MGRNGVVETQQIASLRIHIESAIHCVKEFHIFNGVIPAALAGSANQIRTVCALLTHFQPPLLFASIIPFMQIYVLFVQCKTTKFTQLYTSSVGLDQ